MDGVADRRLTTRPQGHLRETLAGAKGLEPLAYGFGDRRSTHLSYAPSFWRRQTHIQRRHIPGRLPGWLADTVLPHRWRHWICDRLDVGAGNRGRTGL